ncbi:MAG: phage scaffolding protein, partial [Peptostreptococcaceae bacterium]|nr:phage scaffolding protein [Peptostreptococcaceae bacterium]
DKIKADKENTLIVDDKEKSKYVEKEKLDDANKNISDYKKEIKKRDGQLKDLQDKVKEDTDLSEEIEKLKKENKEATEKYEADLKEKDFNYALERALTDSKVKNPKAVKALLNLDNIKVDGTDLIGFKDQIEKLKESDSYLFNVEDNNSGGTGNITPVDNTIDNKNEKELGEKLALKRAEQLKGNEELDNYFK